MALYVGTNKVKLLFNNAFSKILLGVNQQNTSATAVVGKAIVGKAVVGFTEGTQLVSSDNYILKDSNDLYLFVKDGE